MIRTRPAPPRTGYRVPLGLRSIPGRVPDERDLAANGVGAVIGVLVALVLTLPATLVRRLLHIVMMILPANDPLR